MLATPMMRFQILSLTRSLYHEMRKHVCVYTHTHTAPGGSLFFSINRRNYVFWSLRETQLFLELKLGCEKGIKAAHPSLP